MEIFAWVVFGPIIFSMLFIWVIFGWFFQLFPAKWMYGKEMLENCEWDMSTVSGRMRYWWDDLRGNSPPKSGALLGSFLLKEHFCTKHAWKWLDNYTEDKKKLLLLAIECDGKNCEIIKTK